MGDAIQAQLTTADRVRAKLDFDDIVEVKVVGADTPRDFKVCFENHVDADRLGVIQQCFKLEQIDDKCVVVRVPDDWELVAASESEPESTPELTEAQEAKLYIEEILKPLGFNLAGAVVSPDTRTGENFYAINFKRTGDMALSDAALLRQSPFLKSWRNAVTLVVELPDDWKTPTTEAVEPEEGDKDAQLKEQARQIEELNRRNAELQQQLEAMFENRYSKLKEGVVDTAAENVGHYLAQRGCPDIKVIRDISEAELKNLVGQRWQVKHYQFVPNSVPEYEERLCVVLQRHNQSASPEPERAAVTLDHIVYSQPAPDKAFSFDELDHQAETLETNTYIFNRMVLSSALPSSDKETLIHRRRQAVGRDILQEVARRRTPSTRRSIGDRS